jgi:hypothetical protein
MNVIPTGSPICVACRDSDERIARQRRALRTAAAKRVAIESIFRAGVVVGATVRAVQWQLSYDRARHDRRWDGSMTVEVLCLH